MRQASDVARIRELFKLLGQRYRKPIDVYLTGGATAVLEGWRSSTIDVDLRPIPEADEFLRELPGAKEQLAVNIELASPADFIPEVPGWRDRRRFVGQYGSIRFYHYDPYSQALAKIERGHAQDIKDVRSAIKTGWVRPAKLLELFEAIEDDLYRFPAIDPESFKSAVAAVAEGATKQRRGRRLLRPTNRDPLKG